MGPIVIGARWDFASIVVMCCVAVLGALPCDAIGAVGERGFEQVSPTVKGADIDIGDAARAAEAGGAIVFQSFGSLAPGPSRVYLNEYRSTRIAAGEWAPVSINPPFDTLPYFGVPEVFRGVSPDARVGVAKSWGSEESGHPQVYNLWRMTVQGMSGPVSHDLLSAPEGGVSVAPEVPPEQSLGNEFAGGSEDFSHVVFESSRQLIPDIPLDGFPFVTNGAYLYEWTEGQKHLVNLLPEDEGGGFAATSVLGYGSPFTSLNYPGEYAVSADGARISFPPPPRPLIRGVSYMYGSGIPALWVMVRRCTCLCLSGPIALAIRPVGGTIAPAPRPIPGRRRLHSFSSPTPTPAARRSS